MYLKALILLAIAAFVAGSRHKSTLDSLFQNDYDRRIRPEGPSANAPTTVNVNIYLRRITKLPTGVEFEITLRQQWKDPRFALNFAQPVTYHRHLESPNRQLWMPDTFFQNGYNVRMHDKPNINELIRIYGTGEVFLSQRMQFHLPCAQGSSRKNLECNLDMSSYGYTNDDIKYEWVNLNPVQITNSTEQIPEFNVRDVHTSTRTAKTTTGEYSGIRAKFTLESKS